MQTIRDFYLAPGVVVTGDVQLGSGVNVWFGCVIRGDLARITLGARAGPARGPHPPRRGRGRVGAPTGPAGCGREPGRARARARGGGGRGGKRAGGGGEGKEKDRDASWPSEATGGGADVRPPCTQ